MRTVGLVLIGCITAGCSPSESKAPKSASVDSGGSDGADGDAGGIAAPTCVAPTGLGTRHDGETIATDVTWTAAGSPHIISFTPTVSPTGTLRIEPCAVVQIQAGYGLAVEGRLEAIGTATQPITITAADPAHPFSYVEVLGGFADLAYVTLSNGGADGPNSNAVLDVWGNSTPLRTENARLRHVTISGSLQFGLTLERAGTLTADSTDVTITGAKLGPVMARGSALAGGISDGKYTGNGVDEVLVIARDFMSEDTTWHDRGVPYRIGDADMNGADFRVGPSSDVALTTWTLEAGVAIRVTPSGRITFSHATTGTTGTIIARGTAARPIVFSSAAQAPAPGQWRGLVFDGAPTSGTTMDHVEIRYAGGPSQANSFHCESGSAGAYSHDEDAALAFFGEPPGQLLTNSVIADSAADGVDLAYRGTSVDFLAGNTFTNIARCRMTLPRTLPSGTCPDPVPACP
jgi:hypothetical protein